jgi:cell division protease FtsH
MIDLEGGGLGPRHYSRRLKMDNLKRRIAVHEAGHAVIGRALGLPVGQVTIRENEDARGRAQISDPIATWRRGDGPRAKLANSFVVMLFAGGEAERILLRGPSELDGNDCRRATACLAEAGAVPGASVGDEHFDRHEASLRRRATTLVRQHRSRIEQLAEALVERETLTSLEVDALFPT